ncbi:MAG: ABC transporter ATP-binding protein [Anaerolineaceae bacterium]|nr:ABC transporter ATP-binding protein [Anaerolineaceae bacterium]
MSAAILQVSGITKRFPGVLANDRIDFDLAVQEIHALLGENGAGKSTLMNIIYGLYRPDEGQISINGKPVEINDPNHALALGIGMVHQHFMLVPVMTVTENLMLGHEETTGPAVLGLTAKLDRKRVAVEIRALGERYGLRVDPDAKVSDLSVGEAQRVEILKALYRGAKILILDEPTAVLTPQETEDLFAVMRTLVSQGKSIIFITHKLQEVMAIADRITVLRGGKLVGSTRPAMTSKAELASMMVGRDVLLNVEKGPAKPGEIVLETQDLQVLDRRGHLAVSHVNLTVRAGEILGIAGVQGNGQTELVEALTGLLRPTAGLIRLNGKDMSQHVHPRTITRAGVAHVPEDRQKHGLVLTFPVQDNLILQTYNQAPFANGLNQIPEAIFENAKKLVRQFDIRTPSVKVPANNLSGGNQQKVIVARELSRPIRLLIINQPTRGLDVGSIEYIHRRIVEVRDSGVAVLLVSAELDEIMSLSDRIAVMYSGRIVATLDAASADRKSLGLLMAGSQIEGSPIGVNNAIPARSE